MPSLTDFHGSLVLKKYILPSILFITPAVFHEAAADFLLFTNKTSQLQKEFTLTFLDESNQFHSQHQSVRRRFGNGSKNGGPI